MLIGFLVLIIGLLVYLIDRAPNETYFVYYISTWFSLHNIFPNIFGAVGKNLPAFIHVFSFALITAGLLSCQRKGCLVICSSWFIIDCAFELGQRFSIWSSSIIPDWFAGVPFLENSKNYFLLGTFDFLDLVAIAIGSVTAYLILLVTMQRRYSSCQKKTLES
jgi:hypothetical protein